MTLPVPLSAKFKGTFAYETVKDRIPRILTKVIDVCHKHIGVCNEKYGESGRTDALEVVGKLSQLRSEIMTDKPLTSIDDNFNDVQLWNERLENYIKEHGQGPSWFTAPWLYIECFMYRKIASVLNISKHMKDFDPFFEQKTQALIQSVTAVKNLALFYDKIVTTIDKSDVEAVKKGFLDFVQVSLWGNKCDLSISGGEENSQNNADPHKNLETFHQFILVNHSSELWDHLSNVRKQNEKVRVDIVLDNAGFELFSDLVLADFMVSCGLADIIIFHPKQMPWFVSDVTKHDFSSTIDYLISSTENVISELGKKWKSRIDDGTFKLVEDVNLLMFWTLPDPYCFMGKVAPTLYESLSASSLVFFKGDLNYRKLVSDLDWPHKTSFSVVSRGFAPANLCSLRTSKANVIVGLKPGQAEESERDDEDWMVTGKYAVIQYQC